jgi:hypothetical protein
MLISHPNFFFSEKGLPRFRPQLRFNQKEKERNLFIESIISHAAKNFSKLASGYKSNSASPDDLISIWQFNPLEVPD